AGHAGHGAQVNDLLPHSQQDVRYRRGDDGGLVEQPLQCEDALAELAVLLAERDVTPVVQVLDRAVRLQRNGDLGKTAQDAVLAEGAIEQIDVREPVQQRQNGGAVLHRRSYGLDRRVEIVGLASEEDEVVAAIVGG